MQPPATLFDIICAHAAQSPDSIALLAPSRPALTYRQLEQHLRSSIAHLTHGGIRPADRLAVILPVGPELATACLAVSSIAVCVPMNPTYTPEEVRSYLERFRVKALMLPEGQFQSVRRVVRALGVRMIDLAVEDGQPAGSFRMRGQAGPDRRIRPRFAGLDDLALILQTAGTTAQPKLAPLTHRNWFWGACNNISAFGLTTEDRCISVVPMFHIHGLVGTLAASLVAGGSVACTPGFDADRMLDWMAELSPTWYSAAATVHLAVLEQARLHPKKTRSFKLRFIRTAATMLGPREHEALEKALGAPVLQSYGMTEASQIITSNPLPPGLNKVESVGKPVGVNQVRILDDEGRVLPANTLGEIAIRGENVIRGYLDDPETNAAAFVDGWLRTGDLGLFDEAGYLYLQGRTKEMINRGGLKVLPHEVEAALMRLPSVEQAVAFAVPHPTLGEDVAAAVVLADGENATARQLRAAAAETLAPYKVPGRIVIVNRIPEAARGMQGKIRRERMYNLLKSELEPTSPSKADAPRTRTEIELAGIWGEILKNESIGVEDDFFSLGGDSIHAARILARIHTQFRTQLTIHDLLAAPTIRSLAASIDSGTSRAFTDAGNLWTLPSSQVIIPLKPGGDERPIYLVPTIGSGSLYLRELALGFASDLPVYGFQPTADQGGRYNERVEEIADLYCRALVEFQDHGPYSLVGQSGGGCIALAMAHRLAEQGRQVDFLGMLDTYPPGHRQQATWPDRLRIHLQNISEKSPREALAYLRYGIKRQSVILLSRYWKKKAAAVKVAANAPRLVRRDAAILIYEPQPYDKAVVLFKASERPWYMRRDPMARWSDILIGEVRVIGIPGDHNDLLSQPYAGEVARIVKQELNRKRSIDLLPLD